jgi:hypothetical protein
MRVSQFISQQTHTMNAPSSENPFPLASRKLDSDVVQADAWEDLQRETSQQPYSSFL